MKQGDPLSYFLAATAAGLYVGMVITVAVAAWLTAWWAGVLVTCLVLGISAGAFKGLQAMLED